MSIPKKPADASVPIIDARDLYERLSKSPEPYLLDVREPVEFHQFRMAGANLIPLGELSNRLHELPKEQEIVCICATGDRSSTAARQLIDAGYEAASLKDGMIGWFKARLPILKGSSE